MVARTYSPEQTAYLQAKAAYDSACTRHSDLLGARDFYAVLDTADTDTLVQIEMDVERESGHDQAMRALLAAEQALFAWGQTQALRAARAHKQPHETTMLREMFTHIHKHPRLKDKLITMCLALDLSK